MCRDPWKREMWYCMQIKIKNIQEMTGAAADIQIDHGAVMVHAVLKRAAPLAGNDRFQIRSRRGDHKLTGKSAELFRDQGRVFLAGGFSRNDHRAGVELRRGKPRRPVFPLHNPPDPFSVQQGGRFQRRRMDRAFIDQLFADNGDAGHRKVAGSILHPDPAEDHLGGRCANVYSNAQNCRRHFSISPTAQFLIKTKKGQDNTFVVQAFLP